MRITLIGKKYIINKDLPKNNLDEYWVTNNNNKLINIKIYNGKYEAISSSYSKIVDSKSQTISKITLKENMMYPIIINGVREEICILFCNPDYDSSFTHLDIVGTNEITIGRNKNNSIVYNNPLIKDLHAKIVKFKGKWTIENYDSEYGIFVNDFPVYKNTKNIFNGDVIFIMGLRIIIIKDSLYINNFDNNVLINNKQFELSQEKTLSFESLKNIQNDKEVDNKITNYYFKSPKMIPAIKAEKINITEPPAPVGGRKRTDVI